MIRMKRIGAVIDVAVLLNTQRVVVYFYCPGKKTYIVKPVPQTSKLGKLYEKQGAGPWCPLDPRGKSRGK
jgi:hypothetical protein